MDMVWMGSFVMESLPCSLQGGVHAAWTDTQSFLWKTHQPFSSVNAKGGAPPPAPGTTPPALGRVMVASP